MEKSEQLLICKLCKNPVGSGKYCSECGQAIAVKKISVGSIVHEIFHFFTHVDKGLPYTIKRLAVHPGTMQREYLEGQRVKHQKPFSMFLITATLTALALYWLNIILSKYYDAGNLREAAFNDKYMVLLLMAMPLLFSFLTFVFFYSSGFNYAEVLVFSLYTISMFFLMVIIVNLLELIWPQLESRYIELPAFVIYNAVTFKNFFLSGRRWVIILKSVVCSVASFMIITFLQDLLIDKFT
jgi:hypothetical protein